ncbi:MAG: CHAP domain-containing protein [Methanosarcina sp.]
MKTKFKILSFITLFFLVSVTSVSSVSAAAEVGSFELNGVNVIAYANNPSAGVYGYYGLQYECVEYVNRFYGKALGHRTMAGGGHAKQYLGSASEKGLKAYKNGESTTIPCIGDIICSNNGDYGHVAIVRQVLSDRIYVIHQNFRNYPCQEANYLPLTLSKTNGMWKVDGFDSKYQVSGWLRKPVTLTVSPYSGKQGTIFTFRGTGYTPNGKIEFHVKKPPNVWVGGSTEYPVSTFTASSTGVFSYTFKSSVLSPKGTYKVWAVDLSTRADMSPGRQSPIVYETIT